MPSWHLVGLGRRFTSGSLGHIRRGLWGDRPGVLVGPLQTCLPEWQRRPVIATPFLYFSSHVAKGRDLCRRGLHATSAFQGADPLGCVWNHGRRNHDPEW